MKATPNYIKSLVMPSAKSQRGRRVWSIDLETVWLPFFTATNLMGDTCIPVDNLGCPIRLAYDKDGSVRFGRTGRPVTKVAKGISDCVSLVRQNFVANLLQYSEEVASSRSKEYADLVALCAQTGQPILNHDNDELNKAITLQMEEAMRQSTEAQKVAKTAEPEAEPKTEREAIPA